MIHYKAVSWQSLGICLIAAPLPEMATSSHCTGGYFFKGEYWEILNSSLDQSQVSTIKQEQGDKVTLMGEIMTMVKIPSFSEKSLNVLLYVSQPTAPQFPFANHLAEHLLCFACQSRSKCRHALSKGGRSSALMA